MYAARWAAATDLEKQIMAVMATGRAAATATRAEIAAALGRPTQALGALPRSASSTRASSSPPAAASSGSTMPGFDRYIRETTNGSPAIPSERPGRLGAGRPPREFPAVPELGPHPPRG